MSLFPLKTIIFVSRVTDVKKNRAKKSIKRGRV